MRNLASGNKMNFTVFAFIVVVILVIIVCAITIVLRNDKEMYQVTSSACIYDNGYNYIDLEYDGEISKKWTGNYYLKENITDNEYKLGDYAVSFDTLKKSVDLYGDFYQVLRGGDVAKISNFNTINSSLESKFYKIDDRKYLIVARDIRIDTGSLSTQNYLIVIIDKLGNALLLNNEINAKTINEMIIDTADFEFDVANEILMYNDESINLKKIIGSTNEYVQVAKEETENTEENTTENPDENTIENPQGTVTNVNNTTNNNNNSTTTVIQGGNNNNINSNSSNTGNNSSNSDSKLDTGWVDSLNGWIGDVANAFESLYNGSNNSQDKDTTLTKSIALNSLSSGPTYIDVNYTITDPENKYNVVYAIVSDGTQSQDISLDKNNTTYRVTNLNPDTNYTVSIGYKIVYANSGTEDNIEDTMIAKTTVPQEDLSITKVSLNKIYYTLKLDGTFVYDSGAKLSVYVNNTLDQELSVTLNNANLEAAASTGYSGSFKIPEEYKSSGGSVTIQLEDTKYNGKTINTNLMTKIINY